MSEICANVVVPAPLTSDQPKAPSGIVVTNGRAAQVYHGGQLLALLQRSAGHAVSLEGNRDTAVEVGRGELDGVRRHHPGIDAIEPARSPTIPRPVFCDCMIVNAIAPCFRKRSVCNLIHADGARSRSEHLKWLSGPGPAPIG